MVAPPPVPALAEDPPIPVEQMSPTLPYGVGVDTHKAFIQVCVLYQTPASTSRVEQEFTTQWPDLARARTWIIEVLTEQGHWKEGDILRYTIESTGCYHMPVCHAFGGQPTIINPMLAGPTRRKTDVLDARMLAHHSIIALWRPSYILPEQAETPPDSSIVLIITHSASGIPSVEAGRWPTCNVERLLKTYAAGMRPQGRKLDPTEFRKALDQYS